MTALNDHTIRGIFMRIAIYKNDTADSELVAQKITEQTKALT